MAEQDIADIIATTDGDTTWGDDMRGAMTTIDGHRWPTPVLETSNMNTGARSLYWLHSGLQSGVMNCDNQKPKGSLLFVPKTTPVTMSVEVTAAVASSNIYVSLHNMRASDGLPGTVAASWGPFDSATVGVKTLSGLSTAVPASGWYWVMQWATQDGAGCRAFNGDTMPGLFLPATWAANIPQGITYATAVGTSSPVDLSSHNPTVVTGNGGITRIGITE